MRKLINWCKDHIFTAIALALLAFIPLYPKLPLIDVSQTWVYIRFEDFLVAVATLTLTAFLLKEKRWPTSPLTAPIVMYWAVGFISLVNALLFIFPHFTGVLMPKIAVLHYLRRIEYMSLFFVGYEAYRRSRKLAPFLWVLGITYVTAILYGLGQKFLGWPAFLTMNEEFAKGVPLRLPPTARFPSLFGGHYDYAAFLVMTIPIMGSLALGVRRWWVKVVFVLLAALGLVGLLFTASRVSFGVYLVAMSAMLVWHKKPLLIVPVVALSLFVMTSVSGASDRFLKTFRMSDVVVDLSTGKPIGTLEKLEGGKAKIESQERPDVESLPKGTEFIGLPPAADGEKEATESIKKVEIYGTKALATGSGEMATISGSFLIQKALVYDISITTRFQGQWPRAIAAFKRNILLGSGYSALSLAADGDYHRMLGETGLLGTVVFLGMLAMAIYMFVKNRDRLPPIPRAFVIGVFGGLVGLLANAVLIDVFEASKVAFTFWLLMGVAMSVLYRYSGASEKFGRFLVSVFTHKTAYGAYLVAIVFLVWGRAAGMYFHGDDFTWLRWSAESSGGDLIRYFTESAGFFYRPIPKLWYFMLFSVFWLKPAAYHIASLALVSGIVLCIWRILQLRGVKPFIAWSGAALFSVLAVHHENIFWISGHSSLLAALFLIGGITMYFESWTRRGTFRLLEPLAAVSVFLSMLSYDGMLVAPLIVWLLGRALYGKKGKWNLILLLVPIYWFLRSRAGAVSPEGDYGYRLSALPVNAAANAAGYAVATFLGPKVVDGFSMLRQALKGQIVSVAAFAGVTLAAISAAVVLFRRRLWLCREGIVWFVVFFISLAAYMGLGGMTERYAFIPSMFLVIAITADSCALAKSKFSVSVKVMVALLALGLAVYNVSEVNRVADDWQKAGSIVEQTLLTVRKETFPPKEKKHLLFVNTPIRYGRAWVFSMGLTDAIWHMYRQSPFVAVNVPDLKYAYDTYVVDDGGREVFVFDNWQIKRGLKEVREVPATK